MKITEITQDDDQVIIEAINQKILDANFHAEKIVDSKLGPLKLVATKLKSEMVPQIIVQAYKEDGEDVGYARFVVHNYEEYVAPPKRSFWSRKPVAPKQEPYLVAGLIRVWSEYQRKGIATLIYNFMHEMGNDIKPSSSQTEKGQALWKGFANKQTAYSESIDKSKS